MEAAGGFDESHRLGEDWLMWQRVARLGARFGAVPVSLASCGIRAGSLSRDSEGLFDSMMRLIALGHGRDPSLPNARHADGRPPSEQPARAWSRLRGSPARCSRKVATRPRCCPGSSGVSGPRPRDRRPAIFRAVSVTLGRTRDVWDEAWPSLGPRAVLFLEALAAHMEVASFARAA